MTRQMFKIHGILLFIFIAGEFSLLANPDSGHRRVNRAYVESLIAERQAKILSDDDVKVFIEKIEEAQGSTQASLALAYFEEERLDDYFGLAINEAIERGLLPPSAAGSESFRAIDDLAWQEDATFVCDRSQRGKWRIDRRLTILFVRFNRQRLNWQRV